jgi:hypothetical protein
LATPAFFQILFACQVAGLDGLALVHKSEIFIPAELVQQLLAFIDMLFEAQIERYVEFQHGSHRGEKVIYFLKNGERLRKELGSAVRARLSPTRGAA